MHFSWAEVGCVALCYCYSMSCAFLVVYAEHVDFSCPEISCPAFLEVHSRTVIDLRVQRTAGWWKITWGLCSARESMSNKVLIIIQKRLRICMLFFKALIAVDVTDILLVAAILLKCGVSGATCSMKTSWEELSASFQQAQKRQSVEANFIFCF